MEKPKIQVVKTKDFKRIILPVDGSKSSSRAVNKALPLAKEMGVDVIAIHVMEYPYIGVDVLNYSYQNIMEIIKKRGNDLLKEIKNKGSKSGVRVITKLVEGIPDNEIIKEAHKDDLIVMGSKGITALERIFLGSVCEKVLHHSKSTVMIIR